MGSHADKIYHEGLNKFTFNLQMPKIQTLAKGGIILPACIELSPSDVCTQACYYCNTKRYRSKFRQFLKKKPFLDFIESVSHPNQVIKFVGGGEPLVNPHTFEAMEIAKLKGAQNYIITNLEPVKKSNLGKLLELCTWIRIGVDDFSEEVYNKIRRPLNEEGFSKVMSNIKNLLALRAQGNYDVSIGAQMVALEENVHNIYENGLRAKELGFDFLQVRPDECSKNPANPLVMGTAKKEAERANRELSDENFKVFPFEHKFSAMEKEYGEITGGEICYVSNFFLVVGGGRRRFSLHI